VALCVAIAMLLFICFYLFLEIRQIIHLRGEYIKSFWNMVDFISIILNIVIIALDMANYDIKNIRPLAAVAVLFMWIKFFYFLRIFDTTQGLIRMIQEICYDMGAFTAILFVAVFAFSNSFLILARNGVNEENEDPFTGGNLFKSFVWTYRTGLGDFDTDNFETPNEELVWIIFMLCSLLILIILLNMLIAIMGDTFDKVTERTEQSKFKEISQMISENEFVLNRKEAFKNNKYIVLVQLEKAESAVSASWEGKLGTIKTFIEQKANDTDKRIRVLEDGLREEIGSFKREIDYQLADVRTKADMILKLLADSKKKL